MTTTDLLNTSPFKEWIEFKNSHTSLVNKMSEADQKKKLPTYFKIDGEINKINQTVLNSLKAWKEIPDSRFGKIKKKLSFFSQFGALSPFLRLVGIKKEKLIPKESAKTPYEFKEATESEKQKLVRKAKFLNIMAKVMLVASSIIIFSAMTIPTLSVAFLINAPLTLALTVIIGTTIISILGTVSLFAHPLLTNNKITKEARIKADPCFKVFIQFFGENAKRLNMNFSQKNIYDSDIHNIYQKWIKNMNDTLSTKNLDKAKTERDKYVASRP